MSTDQPSHPTDRPASYPPPADQGYDPTMQAPLQTSVWSILSIVFGLLSIPGWFCCFYILTVPLSIGFGVVGLMEHKKGKVSDQSRILAFAGIGLSSLIVVATIAWIALNLIVGGAAGFAEAIGGV